MACPYKTCTHVHGQNLLNKKIHYLHGQALKHYWQRTAVLSTRRALARREPCQGWHRSPRPMRITRKWSGWKRRQGVPPSVDHMGMAGEEGKMAITKRWRKVSQRETKILKIIKAGAGMNNANSKAKKHGKYVKLKLNAWNERLNNKIDKITALS